MQLLARHRTPVFLSPIRVSTALRPDASRPDAPAPVEVRPAVRLESKRKVHPKPEAGK